MHELGAQIVRAEGGFVRAMWMPGLLANASSILISTSTRMGLYPIFRNAMVSGSGAGDKSPVHMFGAGLFAGAVGYLFGSPLYQVKNRQQASLPEARPSTYHCISTLVRENALFRGASVMVGRGAAVTAGQFMGYDLAKTYLNQRNKILNDGPVLHTVSAVCAAFGAATFCCPFDYLMTKYQVQKAAGANVTLFSVLKEISKESPAGMAKRVPGGALFNFYSGWSPLFVRLSIVMSLYMPAYEQVRRRFLNLGYFK
eukprot:Tamp_21026.p1 GENE.Tamp_21026~~Tamp_21026.p1  ORF type:complete len:299 (-),score=46.46 Tamp_21026:269-1036(-)